MSTFPGNTTSTHTTATSEIGVLTGRDVSGFEIFSAGAAGVAHDIAHQMLDKGDYELGYQLLGAWLDAHDGAGSQWVHLQWHMGVFELALGYWDDAFARFRAEILPTAIDSDEALTDAPAMLWRLALAAPRRVDLPWEPVRVRALACMRRRCDPYVVLHNLLALAGAGDIDSLDSWLASHDEAGEGGEPSRAQRVVVGMGQALRAYAAGDYERAGWLLGELLPRLSQVGGSRAQNELFSDIERACWRQATTRRASE